MCWCKGLEYDWLADVANQGGNDVRAVRVRANQKVEELNCL